MNIKKIANFISTIGNPTVLILVYGFFHYLKNKSQANYLSSSLLVYSICLFPVSGFIAYKVRKGDFADQDVSNKIKRNSVYKVLLVSMCIVQIVAYLRDFSHEGKLLLLTFLMVISICYGINQFYKISLHTTFSFLIALMIFPLSSLFSIILFIFSFANAWSRLALNRHTLKEVFLATMLANLAGMMYLFFFYKII
jgi:membrane-associated phospholipid phosphatase